MKIKISHICVHYFQWPGIFGAQDGYGVIRSSSDRSGLDKRFQILPQPRNEERDNGPRKSMELFVLDHHDFTVSEFLITLRIDSIKELKLFKCPN